MMQTLWLVVACIPWLHGQTAPITAPAHAAAAVESLVTFDPVRVELRLDGSSWRMWAGDHLLRDFGSDEAGARDALRAVRLLRLTQRGTIGSPQPVMEYWLSEGQAPREMALGFPVQVFDPAALRADDLKGQWVLNDGNRALLFFGASGNEAQTAVEAIRRYGFTRLAYLRQGIPPMTIFLVGERMQPAKVLQPAQTSPRPIESPPLRPASVQEIRPLTPEEDAAQKEKEKEKEQEKVGSSASGTNEYAFDWKGAQLHCDNTEWKLVHVVDRNVIGTLANFGGDETIAREALTAVRMYQFTQKMEIGRPATFHTFLVKGMATRLQPYGVISSSVSFRRESLRVKPLGRIWVIADNQAPVFSFVQESDARQTLDLIQRLQADKLCRIGGAETGGLTFLVRTR